MNTDYYERKIASYYRRN